MSDKPPPWLAVRVEPAGDREAVLKALFSAGAQGIQEDGTALVTHFPPGTSRSMIEESISAADSSAQVAMHFAEPVDWSAWRASVGAHRLGKLTIAPPWLAPDQDDNWVVIDPAMAFGTGEHPTTRGVVRLMQRLPAIPPVVADLGAGSAVLAICAARLGAKKVIAIELDPDAISNAEENVRVNRVADTVHVVEGDARAILPLIAPVGLVLANIISSVLVELLPVIHDSLLAPGHAILSGSLQMEREAMLEEIDRGGWRVGHEDSEEGWWSVLIERVR